MPLPSVKTTFTFEATSTLQGREWTRKGEGTATFSTQGEDLWIDEEGQWADANEETVLQGALFEKRLVYRKAEEGQLEILKPDVDGGLQPLVTVYPGESGRTWQSEDPHVCAEDLYSVRIAFLEDQELQVTWMAKGPQKDYTTLSCYPAATLFESWLSL